MRIVKVECSCTKDTVYADGSKPFFYDDIEKAKYMYFKLKEKNKKGWEKARNGVDFSLLKDYNFYYAVHLLGEHILFIDG